MGLSKSFKEGRVVVTYWRKYALWEDVTEAEWNDWRWQSRNRITTLDQLKQVVNLTPEEEEGIKEATKYFFMSITPYYAAQMDPDDPTCPVRQLAIPVEAETIFSPIEMEDPLHEDEDSPAPGITHRYPDRVLFLVTNQCPMYCRHCTRRRFTSNPERPVRTDQIEEGLDYIRNTPQVRDVLLSGGDSLMLSDDRLEYIISELHAIPHVDFIRLGTRLPVVLPQRITENLVNIFKKYHPIWLNTHFNHSKEITPETRAACERLANAGVPVGNQTVLLKGVNDCPVVMKQLVHDLLKIRVRPYYMYQCDLSMGLSHFRTTVAKGIEIIEYLRGHTTGMAVPTYVIDAPGGGGKIPIGPNYVVSMNEERVILRNYEGVITAYSQPEPESTLDASGVCKRCGTDHSQLNTGLAPLLQGRQLSLEPEGLQRRRRAERGQIKDKEQAKPSVLTDND